MRIKYWNTEVKSRLLHIYAGAKEYITPRKAAVQIRETIHIGLFFMRRHLILNSSDILFNPGKLPSVIIKFHDCFFKRIALYFQNKTSYVG